MVQSTIGIARVRGSLVSSWSTVQSRGEPHRVEQDDVGCQLGNRREVQGDERLNGHPVAFVLEQIHEEHEHLGRIIDGEDLR